MDRIKQDLTSHSTHFRLFQRRWGGCGISQDCSHSHTLGEMFIKRLKVNAASAIYFTARRIAQKRTTYYRPMAILSVCMYVCPPRSWSMPKRIEMIFGTKASTLCLLCVKRSVRVSSSVNYPKLWTAAFRLYRRITLLNSIQSDHRKLSMTLSNGCVSQHLAVSSGCSI